MKALRLFKMAFSLSLRRTLAHRVDLGFDVALAFVNLATSLSIVAIVFSRTQLLAGWSAGELLVLTGTFSMVTGIRATFLDPSINDFAQQIREGRLDTHLLRPGNSILLATTNRHAPLSLLQSILGLGVVVAGLHLSATIPSPDAIAAGTLLVAVGVTIGWALSVLLATLAFWAPRLSLGPLYGALWDFGRYPTNLYGRWLGPLLTHVFPAAAIATWPAQALTRGPNPGLILGALITAAVAVGLALLLWRLGLRRYTGATS